MKEKTAEPIPVELADGTLIHIEATPIGEEEVGFDIRPFREVTAAIEGIASSLTEALQKVKPNKATVEFGLEMALSSGQLTAVIVQGSGTANLKITLEWSQPSSSSSQE